jgi:hypothetical protein
MTILSPILTVGLLITLVHAVPVNIWHISIWESPAPPPDKGPPLSAHALRDKSKLPYEIAGILGAYVVWVAVSALLIILVGKRLRCKAERSLSTLNMEIVKPAVNPTPPDVVPGPKSPIKQWASPATTAANSFKSPNLGHDYKGSHASVSTFDDKVVEQDKARNMEEMERLYAAVMAHDIKKSPPKQTNGFDHAPLKSPTQNPPELQHLQAGSNAVQALSNPFASSPTSPGSEYSRPTPTPSAVSSKLTKAVSFLSSSHSRTSSAASAKSRPSRISIRGLPISSPISSPDLRESATYVEEPSHSGQNYTPGPPPLIPAMKSAAAHAREMDTKSAAAQAREMDRKGGTRAAPTPLFLRSAAAISTGSLPFREAYTPPQSAPATKVTYLEKRDSVLHPTPRTGVPHTPYSAYQPFTPMTPVTPGRLVTKEDRKRAKKQGGTKVLSDDDMVKSDEEMWQ